MSARSFVAVACALLIGALSLIVSRYIAAPPSHDLVVFYSSHDPPDVRALRCGGRCTYVDLETFVCPRGGMHAKTVIATGHSAPPDLYLGGSPERLADAIACVRPELVVADTCYGFSSPLLDAIAARGIDALAVGSLDKLPPEGLAYGAAFFDLGAGSADGRAAAVSARSGATLQRWRTDHAQIRRAMEDVARWSPSRLRESLVHVRPNLVRAPIARSSGKTSEEAPAYALVPVGADRFRDR